MRLTLVYVAILAVILLLSSGSIYSLFSNRLETRFSRFRPQTDFIFPDGVVPPTPEDVRADLILSLIIVNGFLLVGAGIAGYWLAGVTLRPIQDAYDRQRRFLGDASHELRTPLAILQADLENERDRSGASDVARRNAASHLEEVERMGRIVRDLLTLSRLDEDAGAQHEPAAINLAETVMATAERLRSIAQRNGIALVVAPADAGLRALADRELLEQALANVIRNAILYNKDGGSVTVTATVADKSASIVVADTGVGIAKSDLAKIFDRFYRTDASRSRVTGGSGLGLAIVRSIMHRLHGSVHIESEPGRGTTVTLSVPATS